MSHVDFASKAKSVCSTQNEVIVLFLFSKLFENLRFLLYTHAQYWEDIVLY